LTLAVTDGDPLPLHGPIEAAWAERKAAAAAAAAARGDGERPPQLWNQTKYALVSSTSDSVEGRVHLETVLRCYAQHVVYRTGTLSPTDCPPPALLGLSTLIRGSDFSLAMRRSASVATHAGQTDVFGGHPEPAHLLPGRDPDGAIPEDTPATRSAILDALATRHGGIVPGEQLFRDALAEVQEETGLGHLVDTAAMRLVGIGEVEAKPELFFWCPLLPHVTRDDVHDAVAGAGCEEVDRLLIVDSLAAVDAANATQLVALAAELEADMLRQPR
jgi:hypothetical protein